MIVANPQAVTLKAKLFYGFSDTSRLSILEALREKPLNVGEIVERTGLGQSNVSNHLSCLRDCGLVAREQQGKYAIYQVSDPRVGALLEMADELLADVAKGIYECTRYQLPEESQDAEQ
jgi:DNA-binding transcriptional ArsR family regulator